MIYDVCLVVNGCVFESDGGGERVVCRMLVEKFVFLIYENKVVMDEVWGDCWML